MHWLHPTSMILLTSTVFAVRYLVMPSLDALPAEDATVFMGKIMNRSRRVLRLGLLILVVSEVYLFAAQTPTQASSWRLLVKLALTFAVTLIVLLITVSPHRHLALRVEPWRPQLLDAALALLIALIAASHFE
ncbi:MAG: hypothetical protein ABI882_05650 [Acidobacteriota bacterium]